MHVIALVVMLIATAAIVSSVVAERKRVASLVPVRIKRDRR